MNKQSLMKPSLLMVNVLGLSMVAGAAVKPNLIIIHTDEHNFRTLGCYREQMSPDQAMVWGPDAKVETPNIDRIAHEGVICTKYYGSSPVSTPSRASLMTGLHPQSTGAPKNGMHLLDDVMTFAKVLDQNGYSTSYVGKWHLDGDDKYQFNVKNAGGFTDHRYMMHGGHAKYILFKDGTTKGINEKVFANLSVEDKKMSVNVTDYFTDKALEILERDKDKPFCLMVAFPDPHTPDYARPPYHTMFDNMNFLPPKTMDPKYTAIKPSWAVDKKEVSADDLAAKTGKSAKGNKGAKVGNTEKDDNGHNEVTEFSPIGIRQYFGMVKQIDDKVGEILAFLDKNNLTENTIIIFTSDHGDMYFEHNRFNKGVPYEASARIPFVMRYPAKIEKAKVINKAYTNVDFAPTILGLMGIKNNVTFDGDNTSADFLSKDKVVNGDRIVYFAKSGGWWVTATDGHYKLILDKKEKPYLFDLVKDPDELINFYKDPAYKEIAKRLQNELFIQMEKYKEPGLDIKNRPYVTN